MIRVRHIIANRSSPFLLDADMTATEASRFLAEKHIGGAPVTRRGRLVGFCSERDIVHRVVAARCDPDVTKVSQIMSTGVVCAAPDEAAIDCERRMRDRHVRHLPIIEDGRVVACISLRDLLQSELREYKVEVACLTEYIRGA